MDQHTGILFRWHFMQAPFFLTVATFARPSALNLARLGLDESPLSRTSVEHPGMLASDAGRLRVGLLSSGIGMLTPAAKGVRMESERSNIVTDGSLPVVAKSSEYSSRRNASGERNSSSGSMHVRGNQSGKGKLALRIVFKMTSLTL